MSDKRSKTHKANDLNVSLIQLAFLKKSHRMNARPWTRDMGLDVPGAEAVGYSILFDSDDRPDCVVSTRLYHTPEGAWDAFVNADKTEWYPTYDDALDALADSIGFGLEELEV